MRFPWKFYKTLFSRHAQHVLAKSHLWASKFSKASHLSQILFKREKLCAFHKNCTNVLFRSCAARFGQITFLSVKVLKSVTLATNSLQIAKRCAFHENCTKRSFQVMRSTFWPNRIFEGQESQSRDTGLKFYSKRENSALFMKIVQNAFFRSCGTRFGQIAFLSVKVVMIVTLASNSLQKEKTVRFSWKLHKTLFSGHAQHVLAKSHFRESKFSKSSRWPNILSKKRKENAFHENCTKRYF